MSYAQTLNLGDLVAPGAGSWVEIPLRGLNGAGLLVYGFTAPNISYRIEWAPADLYLGGFNWPLMDNNGTPITGFNNPVSLVLCGCYAGFVRLVCQAYTSGTLSGRIVIPAVDIPTAYLGGGSQRLKPRRRK